MEDAAVDFGYELDNDVTGPHLVFAMKINYTFQFVCVSQSMLRLYIFFFCRFISRFIVCHCSRYIFFSLLLLWLRFANSILKNIYNTLRFYLEIVQSIGLL